MVTPYNNFLELTCSVLQQFTEKQHIKNENMPGSTLITDLREMNKHGNGHTMLMY